MFGMPQWVLPAIVAGAIAFFAFGGKLPAMPEWAKFWKKRPKGFSFSTDWIRGKKESGLFKFAFSILAIHLLLFFTLHETYLRWLTVWTFWEIHLAVILLAVIRHFLGEEFIFWGGMIACSLYFYTKFNFASNDGDTRHKVRYASSSKFFEGNARDHFVGPYQNFLRERFKDNPILADICASESGSRHFEDSAQGKVLINENQNGTTDIGLCQVNSIHKSEADSLGLNLYTPEGNADFTEWLYLKEGTAPWESSACKWREKSDTCLVGNHLPTSRIASVSPVTPLVVTPIAVADTFPMVKEVTDSIVTLTADGKWVGPIVVGNPNIFTFSLLPQREMFVEFKYPDGRIVQSMQPRLLRVGKVTHFWLRVADERDGDFRFSRTRKR